MAKKKKKIKDQMGELVGVAVSVDPIIKKAGKKEKRKKYQEGKEVKSVPTRQELLDLDPDEILNDPEEAAIMAQIIGMQNAGQNTSEEAQPNSQQPEAMGGLGGTPQAPQELGPTGTGGGNIGIGNVPVAGEDQFSGTPRAVAGAG